jgi:hypothetical protein
MGVVLAPSDLQPDKSGAIVGALVPSTTVVASVFTLPKLELERADNALDDLQLCSEVGMPPGER